MAQLRDEYQQFVEQEAEVVVTGPDDADAFRRYWQKNDLPYVGLPDPDHKVADMYGQEVKLLRWGRLPALMVIDKEGTIQYTHYGGSMRDIPDNSEILALLRQLNQ